MPVDERGLVADVMEHVPGNGRVERAEERWVGDRPLLKRARGRRRTHSLAAGACDHLAREVDADHPMPCVQERLGDQSRPAAGIEHQAVGRKVGREDQPDERSGSRFWTGARSNFSAWSSKAEANA